MVPFGVCSLQRLQEEMSLCTQREKETVDALRDSEDILSKRRAEIARMRDQVRWFHWSSLCLFIGQYVLFILTAFFNVFFFPFFFSLSFLKEIYQHLLFSAYNVSVYMVMGSCRFCIGKSDLELNIFMPSRLEIHPLHSICIW